MIAFSVVLPLVSLINTYLKRFQFCFNNKFIIVFY